MRQCLFQEFKRNIYTIETLVPLVCQLIDALLVRLLWPFDDQLSQNMIYIGSYIWTRVFSEVQVMKQKTCMKHGYNSGLWGGCSHTYSTSLSRQDLNSSAHMEPSPIVQKHGTVCEIVGTSFLYWHEDFLELSAYLWALIMIRNLIIKRCGHSYIYCFHRIVCSRTFMKFRTINNGINRPYSDSSNLGNYVDNNATIWARTNYNYSTLLRDAVRWACSERANSNEVSSL